MQDLFERTHILVGDAGVERLQSCHVFLAGLGGVGSFVAEALARMGVGQLTLADHDVVSASNLNRQLVALNSTVGQKKIDVMCQRITDINPDCRLNPLDQFLRTEQFESLMQSQRYDYVVDCIDSLNSKVALISTAYNLGLPVAASMGAGGKLDPTQIKVGDVMDSSFCKLARVVRQRLRRRDIGRGVLCVYSTEVPIPPLPPEPVSTGRARAVNGTVSYMPALFGLTLAGCVIKQLLAAKD